MPVTDTYEPVTVFPEISFEGWLQYGRKKGFCTDVCCITHGPYDGMHKGKCQIVVHILDGN